MDDRFSGHTSDWTQNWNGSIAIKLTAIILWSVMISAFALTAPIMLDYEERTLKEYLWKNQQLVNQLETSLQDQPTKAEIDKQLKNIIDNSDIAFATIKTNNLETSYGIYSEKNFQFPATKILTGSNQIAVITIQHPSLTRTSIIDRVILGSSILAGAILFGLFIFMVTQNVVNKPIRHIVHITHRISSGNKDARFDEERDDEFGKLASFSNEMLDNLALQRIELQDTNKDLITEIQHREEALAASQQKSTFLANMSHEIRTPLSSIIGYTERLRYKKIKTVEEKNEMMDIVLSSSNHLLTLINDVLDFSKIEANKLEVIAEDFSIFSVVTHTVDLLCDKAMEQSNYIKVEYDFPIPEIIHNDATRTKQILLNLCGNALRFTKNGTITIQVSYDQTDNKLVISIKDTGIGMSDSSINRLFKPFSQGDRNTSKNYGGTGLGLVISKKLSELMGGDVSVKSTEGLGSIFTFKINAGHLSDQHLIYEIDKTNIESENYNRPTENFSLSGKVLVIEDTIEIRKLIKAYLEDYGIEITTAENGKEGSELALNRHFDVILMDMQMPVMNGKEAIKLLQENNYTQPVIALTANAFTQQIEEYNKLGFTQVLTKPIVINDLLSALANYMPSEHTNNESEVAVEQIEEKENESMDKAILDLQKKFIKQLPQYKSEINAAINANKKEELQNTLHKLKGIGGSLGLPGITEQADNITKTLIDNTIDSAQQALTDFELYITNIYEQHS